MTQNTSLPISSLVNVAVNLSPQAAQAQDLSIMLILGNSDVIDVEERIRTYDSIDAVAADFGTSAPEYLSALLWFEQAPQPTQVKIGRWAETATQATLNGGTLSATQQLIATWAAVLTPGFQLYIDGVAYAIAPASFAAAANLNAVAALIQTALAAKVASSTCVWNSELERFEIQSGVTGVTSLLSFAAASAAVGQLTLSGQPANGNTFTLNGTAVAFVTVATPGSVTIGASVAATIANLVAFLQASVDAQLVKFVATENPDAASVSLVAATPGVGGNALTLAKVGGNLAVSATTLLGATATDISSMLAMRSTSSGAYEVDGIAAEDAVDAVTIFDARFGQTWYALVIPQADDDEDQILPVAAYIQASNNKHIYGVSTQEAGVISAASTTDIAYVLAQFEYTRTLVQYSSENAYSVASLFGRALTVDYNANASVIDLMYKQEPGIVAETLTATQLDALVAKDANVFVEYNNDTAIIQPGNVCSGDPLDIITGCDWLAVTIMTAVYNLLYTSTTKIPQTDAGTHLIVNAINAVMAQAVNNGLLAPGTWNANGFGTLVQGQFLPNGFYVYAPPVASQSQADREARKSVPIQIAAKLAGAVRTVDITINVNR